MGNIAHRAGNISMKYDAKANTFDSPEANAFIKASYRKGYELPEV
jgi:hypothetical protein